MITVPLHAARYGLERLNETDRFARKHGIMAKRKTTEENNDDVTLEAAMSELAEIVARMESGQATLDDSLAQFERGMQLLRSCHQKLDAASQKIEILTRMSSDGAETAPFDARSTLQKEASQTEKRRKPTTNENDDDDPGLLF